MPIVRTEKRRGRPLNKAKPGTRVSLGLKVTATTKKRIDEAAIESGRTQSQEAELRLEQSFRDQELMFSALELAYGRRLSAMLIMLGEAMRFSGQRAGWDATFTLKGAENWLDLPFAYDQSIKAADSILKALRPKGDPSPPLRSHGGPPEIADPARIGEHVAAGILAEAASGLSDGPEGERAERIHRALGKELAARLSAFNYFSTEGKKP